MSFIAAPPRRHDVRTWRGTGDSNARDAAADDTRARADFRETFRDASRGPRATRGLTRRPYMASRNTPPPARAPRRSTGPDNAAATQDSPDRAHVGCRRQRRAREL